MRRFTSAHALSLIALFVAFGGTGYAASKITSAQVRDGSLTGRDVKDRSLSGRDVRDRSLKAADFAAGQLPSGQRGEAGPAGPQGATGPRGPSGATGPAGRDGTSEAVHTVVRASTAIGNSSEGTVVRSIPLAAGNWVVSAGGVIDNDDVDGQRVGCKVVTAGATIADLGLVHVNARATQVGEQLPFSLTGVTNLSSTTPAELRCRVQSADSADVDVVNPTLTAIKVDKISVR